MPNTNNALHMQRNRLIWHRNDGPGTAKNPGTRRRRGEGASRLEASQILPDGSSCISDNMEDNKLYAKKDLDLADYLPDPATHI